MATDDLEKVVSGIEEAAKAAGLDVVRGWIETSERGTSIIWEDDLLDSYNAFIQQVKRFGCSFIVLSLGRLEESDLDEAVELAEVSQESEARASTLKVLEECRTRLGQVERIEVECLLPGTAVRVSAAYHAEWFEAVYATEDMLRKGVVHEKKEFLRLTDEEVEQIAKELAGVRSFQMAQNKDARTVQAKKYLRTKFEDARWQWSFTEIVQTAKSIYETEMKPASDAAVAEKAEALLAKGLPRREIARQLGITLSQLSKLA